MGGAILPRVYKRQRSNFACPDCRNLVPMAVVVKAAGHLYPAVPVPPAAPPDDRACGAASRRLPAAAATRGGLAAAWRVVVSSLTLHQFRQDRVSSHPPNASLLGFLVRPHPPDGTGCPRHPLLAAPPPLACPARLAPTRRLSEPCRLSRRCWRRLSAPGWVLTRPTGSAAGLVAAVRLALLQVLALSRVVSPVAHTSCAAPRASCAMSR